MEKYSHKLRSFLKLRPSKPQERTVTALLHLRIAQHSSSLPQNGNCIAWIASLQAQEGWRLPLQLWKNITTTSVCTQAHRVKQHWSSDTATLGLGDGRKQRPFWIWVHTPINQIYFRHLLFVYIYLWSSFLGLVVWLWLEFFHHLLNGSSFPSGFTESFQTPECFNTPIWQIIYLTR